MNIMSNHHTEHGVHRAIVPPAMPTARTHQHKTVAGGVHKNHSHSSDDAPKQKSHEQHHHGSHNEHAAHAHHVPHSAATNIALFSNEPHKTHQVGDTETGVVTVYTDTKTASGKPFDSDKLTVASRTIPLHATVKVTDPKTGRSVFATVTDRGPFAGSTNTADKDYRVADISPAVARALGYDDKHPENTVMFRGSVEVVALPEVSRPGLVRDASLGLVPHPGGRDRRPLSLVMATPDQLSGQPTVQPAHKPAAVGNSAQHLGFNRG